MRQEKRSDEIKNRRKESGNGAGLGRDCAVLCAEPKTAGPDQDIVLSKWIALEGTARLAKRHYEKLRERFPRRILDEAAAFDRYLPVEPEAATAMKSGVCGMHGIFHGGIFAGLWEMAQEAGVGLEADLRKIPVRQETIEICEVLGENPYELPSGGCLIMTAGNGNALVAALEREGIPAVMIGRTTKGNDRVLYNKGHKRYLDKSRTDRNYKEMEEKTG